MAISQNPLQEMQYAQYGQPKLSEQDKFLIHTLLADSGVFDMMVQPTPGPSPAPSPSPSPTPSQTPAPSPTPTTSQTQGAGGPTVNVFLQLALAKVRAGDLITAQFANDLVDAVLALDTRLRALEGIGKPVPAPASSTPAPSPTPTQTPAPTPSSGEVSLSSGGRSELIGTEPTIESVTAKIEAGKGVTITVTGDNLGKSALQRVLLGRTSIDLAKLKFARTGFSFLTTTAVVEKSGNRLTVTTSGGEDSAGFTASGGKRVPVA